VYYHKNHDSSDSKSLKPDGVFEIGLMEDIKVKKGGCLEFMYIKRKFELKASTIQEAEIWKTYLEFLINLKNRDLLAYHKQNTVDSDYYDRDRRGTVKRDSFKTDDEELDTLETVPTEFQDEDQKEHKKKHKKKKPFAKKFDGHKFQNIPQTTYTQVIKHAPEI